MGGSVGVHPAIRGSVFPLTRRERDVRGAPAAGRSAAELWDARATGVRGCAGDRVAGRVAAVGGREKFSEDAGGGAAYSRPFFRGAIPGSRDGGDLPHRLGG